jgi:hypothetical protein
MSSVPRSPRRIVSTSSGCHAVFLEMIEETPFEQSGRGFRRSVA